MALHLQFDPNQDYQLTAVNSVVRLFDGMEKHEIGFDLTGELVPNYPEGDFIDETTLFENLCQVQKSNKVPELPTLAIDEGFMLDGLGAESVRTPHFTIEMETGTGKTYVYLRTINELCLHYGFTKFLIVVPSIAIYEGVIKTFEITKNHFRALYGNQTVNLIRYDGAQLSRLRSFSTSTFCEIMVITLDAFNKTSNNLYKPTEKLQGERLPYQFLQGVRPILILDEPQNMESDKSKQALRSLKPLFALRYSATHKSSPNLLYRLTPFEAYQRNLVKKIEVEGITEQENFNRPFLALVSVSGTGQGIRATVKTYVRQKDKLTEEDVILKQGDDLQAKTKRDDHQGGFVVTEINVTGKYVEFENGIRLDSDAALGERRLEIFRNQIEKTIEFHFKAQKRLRKQGVKVLSLFFIDRVANYVEEDGLIRKLFNESFNRLKRDPEWADEWSKRDAEEVQAGYFAQSKGAIVETRDVDEEKKKAPDKLAEKAAFELIMRKKEALLSFNEPVAFLFAHSALREGWDNPNVFQICTLNQTVSEAKKRQEVGRGLRLCVNQDGERLFGDEINILTVVANESYRSYVSRLQDEYRESGEEAPPPPSDASRAKAKRNNKIYTSDPFQQLWKRLAKPVVPHYNINTEALVEECIAKLNGYPFTLPKIVMEHGKFVRTKYSLTVTGESPASAHLLVERDATDGEEWRYPVKPRPGLDLGRRDERLKGLRITDVAGYGDDLHVTFGSNLVVERNDPYEWTSEGGVEVSTREIMASKGTYPVGNLLARAAKETGLTRATINRIFQSMHDDKAAFLLKNPESFISAFTSLVSAVLADHIAHQISFTANGGSGTEHDLEKLFPPEKPFPQRELIPAGPHGLYDQVQKDSQNEADFVRILASDPQLIFYFKFPAGYKVPLPRQIGNYNPDWGIGRKDDKGLTLLYIRETKGTEDIAKLQWGHEKRKIYCAQKYFAALDLDYRPIKGTNTQWWEKLRPENFQFEKDTQING
jgi:type III restriction enzyme